MSECNVILDANIFLHFRQISEVDWPTLTGSDACSLVITPALMTELERKKTFASSATVKKRAKRSVDFLVKKIELDDPILIREKCVLVFRESEPLIDFKAHNLSPDIDDDRYIAAALEIYEETTQRTYIASDDGGIKLKVRSRPISVLSLDETLRLPEELDPETRELREAKRELEQLKAARPKPQLAFSNSDAVWSLVVPERIIPDCLTVEELVKETPLQQVPSSSAKKSQSDNGHGFSFDSISNEEIERHNVERSNERLRQYHSDYEKYLIELASWLEQLCRIETAEVKLINDGLAAATNLSISIVAPEGLRFHDTADLPSGPKEPEKPSENWAWESVLRPSYLDNLPFRISHQSNDRDVYISECGKTLSASVNQSNPQTEIVLEKFAVEVFDRSLVGQTMPLKYEVSFTEGAPIFGRLPVRIEQGGIIDHRK